MADIVRDDLSGGAVPRRYRDMGDGTYAEVVYDGASGGAPATGAGTAAAAARVTHASDDPAVATLGATGDAAVAAGATGSLSAKLRAISRDIVANIVLAAGSAIIGKVGIDQTTPGTTNRVDIGNVAGREYETVAASQTAQPIGAAGAAGDDIDGLLVIPATTSPGQVLLLDGATSITLFVGGASSVSNLIPFYIPLGLRSVSGAWKVTTGADVSVIAGGNFT